eukprot:762945-Hanusia_phi.AAC.2
MQEGAFVLFKLTGQVTFKLNDVYAGVIRGVPADVRRRRRRRRMMMMMMRRRRRRRRREEDKM